MSPHSREEVPASPRGTPRWIAMAWLAVLSVVAYHHMPVAQANHPHPARAHISTIHGNDGSGGPGSQDEQYCIQSQSSAINGYQLGDFIQETLTKLDFSIIWDGSANWRVDLWRTAKLCNEYDSATRGTIEIEYQMKDSWAEIPTCYPNYSCVVFDNGVVDSVDGHTHYKWAYSYLRRDHAGNYDTRARKFINHETGHVLGLADPRYNGDCPYSVMHNDLYSSMGCTHTVYHPTTNDFSSVIKVADRVY
jgi:hypothetical protein